MGSEVRLLMLSTDGNSHSKPSTNERESSSSTMLTEPLSSTYPWIRSLRNKRMHEVLKSSKRLKRISNLNKNDLNRRGETGKRFLQESNKQNKTLRMMVKMNRVS